MALHTKQTLQQRLVMAPNLTVALEILRMPMLELQMFLRQQTEENPLLEMEELSDEPLVVVEIPHLNDLLGSGWLRVVVVAPAETRLARLIERGMEPADARARMAAQPAEAEWTNAADFVLDNGDGVEELEAQVDRLIEAIVTLPPPSGKGG